MYKLSDKIKRLNQTLLSSVCVFILVGASEASLTITALLSLDFSDDAMVKWSITESVLKEIYENRNVYTHFFYS